ncbi:MAG TPA: hypothetical protein VLV16_08350 [Gemmatimonadales bacterium]|nr:hypothetical protein [Gemmatimonadales bacterium]
MPVRVLSAGLLWTLAAACTSLKPIKPAEYIPKYGPDVVWVTASDKTVVTVADPQVARDTLTGTRKGTQEQVTLPLTDVRTVSAKLPDHGKTAVFLIGMGALTTAVLYHFWISKEGPNTAGVDCGVYDTATLGHAAGSPKPDC